MGDYWKPVFCRLEAEGFECVLAGARQVKNLPGRPKRDPPDSRWLAACFERGAVTGCFVATPEFRESAAIKISSVITNLHGMTGRLVEALDGAEFFTREHAALLKAMLERIDRIDAGIARLSAVIEELLAPYEEQLQQAESMPGWQRRAAGDVLAETGPDMTRFPAPGHLASWAGRTPLDRQSGQRAGKARRKLGDVEVGVEFVGLAAAEPGDDPVLRVVGRECLERARVPRALGDENGFAARGSAHAAGG